MTARPVRTPRPCSPTALQRGSLCGSTASENRDWSRCSRAYLPVLQPPPSNTRLGPAERPSAQTADRALRPLRLLPGSARPSGTGSAFRGARGLPPALVCPAFHGAGLPSRPRAHGAPTAPTQASSSCDLRPAPALRAVRGASGAARHPWTCQRGRAPHFPPDSGLQGWANGI